MNFFRKLFGDKQPDASQNQTPIKNNVSAIVELEEVLKPLIREATNIHLQKTSLIAPESQFRSHFGGQPYFEENESWPLTKKGAPLEFICQVVNTGNNNMPGEIGLLQFYYDFEEFPWETSQDGWLVKAYPSMQENKFRRIEKPGDPTLVKYCEMHFERIKSLPDWEGFDLFSKGHKGLKLMRENDPYEIYDQAVNNLIGEQDYRTQTGGYPKWVQGESTPKAPDGRPMQLLMQIDSEEDADIMWGDAGVVYIFYDSSAPGKFEFTFQCC